MEMRAEDLPGTSQFYYKQNKQNKDLGGTTTQDIQTQASPSVPTCGGSLGKEGYHPGGSSSKEGHPSEDDDPYNYGCRIVEERLPPLMKLKQVSVLWFLFLCCSKLRLQLPNGSNYSFELDCASLFICMGPANPFWSLNYLWSVYSFDNGVFCFYAIVMVLVLKALLVSQQQVFFGQCLAMYGMPPLWARLLEAAASM